LSSDAVEKIFTAKQRPSWDPLIVHVDSREMLARVADSVSSQAEQLMGKFWPGPLTLLLPRNPQVPLAVTAGRETVGVRMPAHPVALALIRAANLPLAAPSANRFGHTSPTNAQHVLDDLDGRIDAVIDSGSTSVGVESTVLDLSVSPPVIYRPGAVTQQMLAEVIGEVRVYSQNTTESEITSLPSPGVGIRHYAPRARLLLAENQQQLADLQIEYLQTGARVGVMLPAGWPVTSNGVLLCNWAAMGDPAAQAQSLFAALRTLDELGAEIIICPLPVSGGIGDAMADRLRKAAMKA